MLLAAVGVWCVIVYSFWVALLGNPLYGLLQGAESAVVERADALTRAGQDATAIGEMELALLRRFSRLSLLEAGAFVLEMAVLVYLLSDRQLAPIAWALIAKNIVLVALSIAVARVMQREAGLLAALRELPGWLVWTDRLSALVSGAGFVAFFLVLNGFVDFA